MKITKKTFGTLSSGEEIDLYTLTAGDLRLSASTLGAALTSLYVPSKKNGVADVLLGYSTLGGYAMDAAFFGVTVGRFANRIGGAQFDLNGKTFKLLKNDGENSLHSGLKNFGRLVWKAEQFKTDDGVFVRFELDSPDGDEGFPGKLKASVCYGITKSNEVAADYKAKVDADCPVNLTNHAYFNLTGEGRGDVLAHDIVVHSSYYVEVDAYGIPTGEILPVQGTPFDFRIWKPIGNDIGLTPHGYDHCFVIDGDVGKLRPCAEVFEPVSWRTMRVFTTQPGVQFYTGNFLDGVQGKTGSVYGKRAGFCLETQHFPDSPNKPQFPSCIFGPERDYSEKTVFKFDW
ncbi:MAG: galactose mutarotase [Treponema sp.]|jgi:aldose 1-epimerase|nr:galactose mutarotase [Treponema sp.]